jgi:hypothetical protein
VELVCIHTQQTKGESCNKTLYKVPGSQGAVDTCLSCVKRTVNLKSSCKFVATLFQYFGKVGVVKTTIKHHG